MVEFVPLSTQTHLDIAQTFSVSELSEGHAEKLFEASKVFDFAMTLIFFDTTSKCRKWKMGHELCKNRWGCVHDPIFAFATKNGELFSNRL